MLGSIFTASETLINTGTSYNIVQPQSYAIHLSSKYSQYWWDIVSQNDQGSLLSYLMSCHTGNRLYKYMYMIWTVQIYIYIYTCNRSYICHLNWCNSFWERFHLLIEAGSFSRPKQINFLVWKFFYFDQISLKFAPKDAIHNAPWMIQKMVSHQNVTKPLSDPIEV